MASGVQCQLDKYGVTVLSPFLATCSAALGLLQYIRRSLISQSPPNIPATLSRGIMSSENSQRLVQYREKIAALSGGKDANEEAWMTMWCSSNWAELLQPAPLSIALLGSVLCIASGISDFSLLSQPQGGAPTFQWKHVKHPDSFKTCLMQMVGDGYTAFENAHTNMETIQALSEQMPRVIRDLVEVLIKGTEKEIELFFESRLNNLLSLSQRCEEAATACEKGFQNLSDLTQELSLGCTYKGGNTQQAIEANATYLRVLREEKDRKSEQIQKIEEASQLSRTSFEDAQNLFRESVKSMPSAWGIFGMNVLEGLVGVVGSATSAFTSIASFPVSAFQKAKDGSPGNNTDKNKQSRTQISPSNLIDPGVQRAPLIKAQVLDILQLLAGDGESGSDPDWERISGHSDAQSGGEYVRRALQISKDSLDPRKRFSADLIQAIDVCLPIIDQILAHSRSAHVGDTSFLPRWRSQIDSVLKKVDALCQSAAYMSQMAGTTANGFVNPPTPEAKGKAAEIAVAAAQHKIDVTRANLTASRDAYMHIAQERQRQQSEITRTIVEMTRVDLENATLREMVPILRKAMGSFNILRARFSQLAQFFHSIVSLVKNVMGNHTVALTDALRNGSKIVLGGVSLPDFTRDMIYRECMATLKVAMLSTKVSSVYVKVSAGYILPAQRRVAEMLEFAEDSSPEGRKKLLESLTAKQRQLETLAQSQSQEILALIERDQQQFRRSIDDRLERISSKLRILYPAVTGAPPAAIQQLADDHVEKLSEAAAETSREDRAKMFNIDDLM
ncbi:hypothetical protein BC834DRAFT_630515 [Gloeopeniophorella convolvens]|nr:hypothetical protein BC834DRAFT_630515 [Gloeopeniophorella convolvens]